MSKLQSKIAVLQALLRVHDDLDGAGLGDLRGSFADLASAITNKVIAEMRTGHLADPKQLTYTEIDLLGTSGKLMAIKAFRERTGWGLKESKDAVDAYIRDHMKETYYNSGRWVERIPF